MRFKGLDTSKSTNGAGLGLYLSRKIVEAHGGKIWIERNTDRNEDEDERGALFAFSLPIKNQSRQATSKEDIDKTVKDNGEKDPTCRR